MAMYTLYTVQDWRWISNYETIYKDFSSLMCARRGFLGSMADSYLFIMERSALSARQSFC